MEQNVRLRLINSILTTPHRAVAEVRQIHEGMLAQDPILYAPFGVWYMENGEVRDHKEVWVATLFRSEFPEHREAAFALLQDFPPYEVARIVRHMKGFAHQRLASTDPKAYVGLSRSGKKRPNPREPYFGGKVHSLGFAEFMEDGKTVRRERVEEEVGPFRSVPRVAKSAVEYYLRTLEVDQNRFDRAVLAARDDLRYLYSTLRIKPSASAQQVLFDDSPPAGSILWVTKELPKADPAEQARIIVEHNLSYRAVSGILKHRTPALLAALVHSMSPQEVLNNLASLKKDGAFENADIKSLIDEKIAAAKTAKRVSAYKAKIAATAAGVSEEVARALEEVTEARLEAQGEITWSTGLLIDKSGSLQVAIETGKQIAAMIASRTKAALYIYAMDEIAYPVDSSGKTHADFEHAFRGIKATGGTSLGVGIEAMRRAGQMVDQFVLVTDEGENRVPYFANAYIAYQQKFGVSPHVIIVRVPGSELCTKIQQACASLAVSHDVYDLTHPKADYYALPGLIKLLSRKSQVELLTEILATTLPKRPAKREARSSDRPERKQT